MKRRSKLSLQTLGYAGLALAAIALVAYAFWPPSVEVEIVKVERGRLQVTIDEDGKTRIKDRYVVVAPLAGELMRVRFHAGDPVRAGETVLAVIEPGDPSLLDVRARTEAEARVNAAQARLDHARTLLDRSHATRDQAAAHQARLERLLPEGATSQEEYDLAVHAMRTATEDERAEEFAVKIATYELELAKAALLRTQTIESPGSTRLEIVAPISGEVLRVFRESAGLIAPGAELMELGDPRDLEVEIDVLSADAVRIPTDATVYLEHWGAPKPLRARVRVIEPQAFLKVSALGVEEQRVNVIADFIDPPESRSRLGDAFRVEARIVIWEGVDVLKVSAGALFRHQGGWAVYRVLNGRAVLTKVKVDKSSGLETQITDGLQAGDEVVAYPSDQVHDGVRIVARPSRR